jgi:hypothetical protein
MTTEELESIIESLTLDQIHDYWIANPAQRYRIVTLGPDPLSIPSALNPSAE